MSKAKEIGPVVALLMLVTYIVFYYWVFSGIASVGKTLVDGCGKTYKIDRYVTTDLFCEVKK